MFVNRWAILVRGKQPYVDWANSFDDGGPTLTLAGHRAEPTLYLVHEHEGADLDELIVEWYWDESLLGQLQQVLLHRSADLPRD